MRVARALIVSLLGLGAAAGCGSDGKGLDDTGSGGEGPGDEDPGGEGPAGEGSGGDGPTDEGPECPQGTEGCECYSDGTCDAMLQCGPNGTCSEQTVALPYKAGVLMRVFGTGACAVPQGVERGIGDPPPDSAAAGKGTPLSDGEQTVHTSCSVSDGPTFAVVATVAQSPISFRVDGQISAAGLGTGAIGLYIPEANGELSSSAAMPCTLTAIQTSAGYQIKAGAVWAKFSCAEVTQAPAYSCRAEGEFVFENCQ
jgi:hypothetical protein